VSVGLLATRTTAAGERDRVRGIVGTLRVLVTAEEVTFLAVSCASTFEELAGSTGFSLAAVNRDFRNCRGEAARRAADEDA
jgi:hypothetical protein